MTANSRMDTDRYVIREYDRENASRMSSYGSPDSAGSTTLSYESEEREYVNRYLANRDKNKRVPNAIYEVKFLLVALNYVFAHIPNNVMLKAIQKNILWCLLICSKILHTIINVAILRRVLEASTAPLVDPSICQHRHQRVALCVRKQLHPHSPHNNNHLHPRSRKSPHLNHQLLDPQPSHPRTLLKCRNKRKVHVLLLH